MVDVTSCERSHGTHKKMEEFSSKWLYLPKISPVPLDADIRMLRTQRFTQAT